MKFLLLGKAVTVQPEPELLSDSILGSIFKIPNHLLFLCNWGGFLGNAKKQTKGAESGPGSGHIRTRHRRLSVRGVHERRAKSIETKRLKSNSKGKTWSKSSGAPTVRNYDTDRHRDKKETHLGAEIIPGITCSWYSHLLSIVKMCAYRIYFVW